ncbi:conserved hypothetical protein [Methylobacterium sp. 4-46]|uniref:hypothetical protein n=1 Tax=unclassified Methylobacterium TaxID=2615210 RepID=UPI000152DF4D|nr:MULTISPECIES: hypothetical protein [Methylobacterium]ACA18497.1 conserved hypothetical protein [Methylobacterium sp. 4-46]WFT77785.1 hypothetical protein QA634_21025 [Methylobacterium nodulans]
MSLAARRRARVAAAVDRQWGEAVRLTPRAENQYTGPGPDPDRGTPVEVIGRYTRRSQIDDDRGAAHGIGARFQGVIRVAGAETCVVIGTEQAALIPWTVRKGDLVELLERGGAAYAVAVSRANDAGGLLLMLTAERAP